MTEKVSEREGSNINSNEKSIKNENTTTIQSEANLSKNEMTDTFLKKRGRKVTDPALYLANSEKKILEWKHLFKDNPNMSKEEKQKLRNRISAQGSRRNKKQEH